MQFNIIRNVGKTSAWLLFCPDPDNMASVLFRHQQNVFSFQNGMRGYLRAFVSSYARVTSFKSHNERWLRNRLTRQGNDQTWVRWKQLSGLVNRGSTCALEHNSEHLLSQGLVHTGTKTIPACWKEKKNTFSKYLHHCNVRPMLLLRNMKMWQMRPLERVSTLSPKRVHHLKGELKRFFFIGSKFLSAPN